MFHFANPEYLYALILVPVFIIVYIINISLKKKSLEKFGEYDVIKGLMPLVSKRRPLFKFILMIIALALIVFAAARPQFGSKLREVKAEGVEIIIALDVSNSMLAEDIRPSRLKKAKRAIARLLDNLKNDKIGLIVFAGDAYTQVPITTDYTATKMFLSSINTDFVPKQGTAISEAIRLAMKSYSPDNEQKKVLIILTDGENHEDDPINAAKEAKEKGILVNTIGMGLNKGVPIPVKGSTDYRKDANGNVIITKLDEATLVKVAQAGGGIYTRSNNAKVGLSNLYKEIEKLDKSELETVVYSEYEDNFQYFIGFALLLLLIEFIILERKNKRFKKLNLFNIKLL
jgi:Ca-activated chloride channel family protein